MKDVEVYAEAVGSGLLGLTEARIMFGSASWRERLGFRWPWLFRKYAADNRQRDARSREVNERFRRMIEMLDVEPTE